MACPAVCRKGDESRTRPQIAGDAGSQLNLANSLRGPSAFSAILCEEWIGKISDGDSERDRSRQISQEIAESAEAWRRGAGLGPSPIHRV